MSFKYFTMTCSVTNKMNLILMKTYQFKNTYPEDLLIKCLMLHTVMETKICQFSQQVQTIF